MSCTTEGGAGSTDLYGFVLQCIERDNNIRHHEVKEYASIKHQSKNKALFKDLALKDLDIIFMSKFLDFEDVWTQMKDHDCISAFWKCGQSERWCSMTEKNSPDTAELVICIAD